jgi:Tfp pilus assembly protein PilF
VYLKTNQTELAETTLRRVLADSPYDSDSHLQLAKLLEKTRRTEEARNEYKAVLITDPANAEAHGALQRLQDR